MNQFLDTIAIHSQQNDGSILWFESTFPVENDFLPAGVSTQLFWVVLSRYQSFAHQYP